METPGQPPPRKEEEQRRERRRLGWLLLSVLAGVVAIWIILSAAL